MATLLPMRTKVDKVTSAGYILIIAMLTLFVLWMTTIPLADSSLAQGSITVGGERQTVAHLDGGKIDDVFVKVGDPVKKGQPLLSFDHQPLRTELHLLTYQLFGKEALLDRLRAERQGVEALTFRESLRQAALMDPLIRELMEGEQRNFDARRNAFRIEISLLDHSVTRSSNQQSRLEQQLASVKRQITLVEGQITDNKKLISRGFGRRADLVDFEAQRERLITERLALEGQSEEIAAAKRDAEIRKRSLSAKFENEIEEMILITTKEIEQAKEKIGLIKTKIDQSTIYSSIDGIIVNSFIRSNRDIVTPASPIFEIVPQNSQLMVEASIAPYEIDGIHQGTEVEVRFPIFINQQAPTILGTVTLVSADVISDGDAPYYRIQITVNNWAEIERQFDIRPGMPAEIIVKKASRTPIGYLLGPLIDHFAKAFL